MKVSDRRAIGLLPVLLVLLTVPSPAQVESFTDSTILQRLRLFAPAVIAADTTRFSPGDRHALEKIIEAGKLIEDVYFRQSWAGSRAMLDSLAADTSAGGKLRLRYFMVNMSPWSLADRSLAFLPGVPVKKPAQANLYPEGMKRSDWGTRFIGLDDRRQAEAAGPRHVVRWDSGGKMIAVPYSEEYRDLLEKAGVFLREAGSRTSDTGTKEYLKALAAAFESNDYRESDRVGVAADGPISVTMGPTSLSLDELFHYKKAFEVVIGVRNESATRQMKQMERSLPEIEKALIGTASAPGRKLGENILLRIDDAVYIGGAARAGAVASTLHLPADSTVIPSSGGKTILLRNIHEKKFALIQAPIAAAMLEPGQAAEVTFDAYFLHLMMHELSHRIDRGVATRQKPEPSVETTLTDASPALSEAKADLAGLFGVDFMAGKGVFPATILRSLYITQLSELLRALRFGSNDPFSAGAAIQFNYHREQRVLSYDPTSGIYRVDIEKMKASARRLFSEIAALQSEGDSRKTTVFYEKYSPQPPELRTLRERLAGIPYDLEPSFPITD